MFSKEIAEIVNKSFLKNERLKLLYLIFLDDLEDKFQYDKKIVNLINAIRLHLVLSIELNPSRILKDIEKLEDRYNKLIEDIRNETIEKGGKNENNLRHN